MCEAVHACAGVRRRVRDASHLRTRVLEVGELDFHRTKLDAPPDVRPARPPHGRRLPAHGLPVGALQVLEVVGLDGVVQVDAIGPDHL